MNLKLNPRQHMVETLVDHIKSFSDHEIKTLWMFSIKQMIKTMKYGHI